jgi:hypothetical protein
MIRITMVVLTEDEKQRLEGASWGCFTREADRAVGRTMVRLLTEGFIVPLSPDDLAEFVAQQSGVEEVADSEARDLLDGRMMLIQEGAFPFLLPHRDS